jgi:adenylate kinase
MLKIDFLNGSRMNIILLGAPGAGKGTQAANLAERLKLTHVATGDLFRKVAREKTPLAETLRSYMEKGLLVPDEITVKLLLERIAGSDAKGGVVFDGFPRTLAQAKALDNALAKEGIKIDKAVLLEVTPDELTLRLSARWVCPACQAPYHKVASPPKVAGRCDKCDTALVQRADDTPVTVKKRLEVYFAETAPLTDYYRAQGKLVTVNGEGAVEEVEKRIASAVGAGK